jgi:hypothetical protein
MNAKKVMSIVALVTAAAIFASASVLVKPAIAQTFGGGADGGASSSSGKYQQFKSCLSAAEKNGAVTEQQIRDCFSPIYNPDDDSDGTTSKGNNDYGSSDSSTSSNTNYGNSDGDGYNYYMEENEQK